MNERVLTPGQQETLGFLKKNFGLSEADLERILFLNDRVREEPWIPADIHEAIARQVGGFRQISVTHDKYIEERKQVLYTATVVDLTDRVYIRSGAALIGEVPNGIEIDPDILAQTRALNAALNAAGFNPFKPGSVVDVDFRKGTPATRDNPDADEAELRNKDLRQIHVLAEEKGLIINKDMSRYRQELKAAFGFETAAVMNRADRAAVINWLNNYQSFMSGLPAEIQEGALIA